MAVGRGRTQTIKIQQNHYYNFWWPVFVDNRLLFCQRLICLLVITHEKLKTCIICWECKLVVSNEIHDNWTTMNSSDSALWHVLFNLANACVGHSHSRINHMLKHKISKFTSVDFIYYKKLRSFNIVYYFFFLAFNWNFHYDVNKMLVLKSLNHQFLVKCPCVWVWKLINNISVIKTVIFAHTITCTCNKILKILLSVDFLMNFG